MDSKKSINRILFVLSNEMKKRNNEIPINYILKDKHRNKTNEYRKPKVISLYAVERNSKHTMSWPMLPNVTFGHRRFVYLMKFKNFDIVGIEWPNFHLTKLGANKNRH